MSQPAQAAAPDGKLAAATTRAKQLAATGDLAAAYAHLHQALAAAPAHPEAELAAAGVVYAYTLTSTGHPEAARAWARWAHTTIRRLHGEHDPRTLHATHLVAVVHQRTGDHTKAVAVWQHLIDILTIHDGPDTGRTLAARADLAVTLHTAGACDQAHTELAQAWATRRASHGDRDPLAVKMLTRLARMYRDCANPDQADTCHTLTHHLDRDSADRVAGAARGPADPDHQAVCTHNPPPPQPDPAAAWPPDITAEPGRPHNR